MLLKFLCIALISVTLAQAAAVSNEFPKLEGDKDSTNGDLAIKDPDYKHQKLLEYPVSLETAVSSAVTEAGIKKPGGIFGVFQDVGKTFRDIVKKNAEGFKNGILG